MLVSLIYLTYRPGGYDVLVNSLRHQTEDNYELIVVDDYEKRTPLQVRKYLQNRHVKVAYVSPSKPKSFPDTAYNLINAYNTGVMLSRGDVVVIMNDYTWFPQDTIAHINENEDIYEEGKIISSVAEMYSCPPPPYPLEKYSVFEKPWQGHPATHGYKLRQLWTPQVFELFFSVIPYHVLETVNGFPECFDYTNNNQVEPFIKLCNSHDYIFGVDHEMHCMMLDHRDWGMENQNNAMWHLSRKPPTGSTVLKLRENPFDLKNHTRGQLGWVNSK